MENSFFSEKYRFRENLHIFFWLLKDSCWMMEWKLFGTFMIIPTISLAIWMIYRTRQHPEIWINLSVLVWVMANSWWMLTEFSGDESRKYYSAIPFSLGFIFFGIYVYRYRVKKRI
jgi:Ca2+/Na+ antiporter